MQSQTRVVFLQHPRETRMPIGTCRLAHLSLPNSELVVGLHPEREPRLAALAQDPGTMLLFPGEHATDISALDTPPTTLLVVDGTWINARKLVQRSPLLAAVPRLCFVPPAPSNYRIRREPAAHCVSTIEAVVHVLEVLERAPGRFRPILQAFDHMVDRQLDHARAPREARPARHPVHDGGPRALAHLHDRLDQLVLVFAACHVPDARDGADQIPPEILQLVAWRPTDGARYSEVIRPRQSSVAHRPYNLGLEPEHLLAGAHIEDARAAWRQFSRPDDVWVTWGSHTAELLRHEGFGDQEVLDLKRLISAIEPGPVGGVEALALRLGARLPEGQGRGARKIAALHAVVTGVNAGNLGFRAARAAERARLAATPDGATAVRP